jgi:hypothetical protein
MATMVQLVLSAMTLQRLSSHEFCALQLCRSTEATIQCAWRCTGSVTLLISVRAEELL